MAFRGLFVGLTTLDCIYQVEGVPQANQKIVATASTLAAGGPATNAAVAFSHLGHRATVLSVVGCHPMRHLIANDLEAWGVAIADMLPHRTEPPPVSSILITEATGDRAVVSMNATTCQASVEDIPPGLLHNGRLDTIDIVLIDGHQMAVGAAIAHAATQQGIPVVIDGGSWKPGFETVLPHADIAICSAHFYPPDCFHPEDVIRYLKGMGIAHIAITQGDRPIRYDTLGASGTCPVPSIQPVDTLGAGDIFHGAFCHFWLEGMRRDLPTDEDADTPKRGATEASQRFITALEQAAAIAAQSCQSFGTRHWMKQ